MAYATLVQLKEYLSISTDADDHLLERLLSAATAVIEQYTGRCFAATPATRRYGAERISGSLLLLDGDLWSLESVTNAAGETIPAGGVVLIPRTPPHYALRLRMDYSWSVSGENDTVSVTGAWGWSATPPADIVQACVRLAAYFYRQKDSQVFDVTAIPDAGVITVPKGLPVDVRIILDRYRTLV